MFWVISAAGQRQYRASTTLVLQEYSAVIVKQKCPKNVKIAKIAQNPSLPKMVSTSFSYDS